MPEPIHERYQCEGFYGFGIGVELAELSQHTPGAQAYCNRCPIAQRCWFRHRGRVMWLFSAMAAATIAAMNEHHADDPDAPPGEAILENDPFVPVMMGNVEDGSLAAAGQQTKDRGPFSIHLDERGRPKPTLGDVDWPKWATCATCSRPIFNHEAWSHEGGTPPQDHEAWPAGDFDA